MTGPSIAAFLLAAAAALTAAVPAGAAPAAGPPDDARYRGLCGFHPQDDGVTHPPGTAYGYLYGAGAAYSVWREHNPVTITRLACDLLVGGVSVGHAESGGGPVVLVPPVRVDYPAGAAFVVCQTVELADAHGQTRSWTECPPRGTLPIPPHEATEAERYYVDPVVCPLLAARGPSPVPEVEIEPDGDLYVLGERVWTCPPYQER